MEDFQVLEEDAWPSVACARNRKTLFEIVDIWHAGAQTYLEEKIRLEGAAVSAENVAEVETNEAAALLARAAMDLTGFQAET